MHAGCPLLDVDLLSRSRFRRRSLLGFRACCKQCDTKRALAWITPAGALSLWYYVKPSVSIGLLADLFKFKRYFFLQNLWQHLPVEGSGSGSPLIAALITLRWTKTIYVSQQHKAVTSAQKMNLPTFIHAFSSLSLIIDPPYYFIRSVRPCAFFSWPFRDPIGHKNAF